MLDLGCGVGRHALYLAAKGFEVVALDGSQAGLTYAEKKADGFNLAIEFHHQKLFPLNFPDGAFDYDKKHPHCYFNQKDVQTLFHKFNIIQLEHMALQKPGSFHWHYLIEKTP